MAIRKKTYRYHIGQWAEVERDFYFYFRKDFSMQVLVELLNGRENVKRAMLATQGKKMKKKELSDLTMEVLLLGEHSVLDEMRFIVEIDGLSERVHTHIVRHKEIGKYVSTSRPDWSDGLRFESRFLLLNIPVKRLIEIMRQRLCTAAYKDTRFLFWQIREMIKDFDEIVYKYLAPPCSFRGYCTEVRTECNRHLSIQCQEEYRYFLTRSATLKAYFLSKKKEKK